MHHHEATCDQGNHGSPLPIGAHESCRRPIIHDIRPQDGKDCLKGSCTTYEKEVTDNMNAKSTNKLSGMICI
eukprot:3319121-Karenia_brevis.AAC.1